MAPQHATLFITFFVFPVLTKNLQISTGYQIDVRPSRAEMTSSSISLLSLPELDNASRVARLSQVPGRFHHICKSQSITVKAELLLDFVLHCPVHGLPISFDLCNRAAVLVAGHCINKDLFALNQVP